MPNNKRGAKRATPNLDHLRDIPTPLHGADWRPAKTIREQATANGARQDDPAVGLAIAAADAAWRDYRDALRRADDAHHGGAIALAPLAARRAREDQRCHVYNRARLGAWTAAAPETGLVDWALIIAETRLAKRLAKRTKGVVTIDMLPDLPRRCDLTDAAVDAARDLQAGQAYWPSLVKRIDAAADLCLDEALGDMGWTDSMAD